MKNLVLTVAVLGIASFAAACGSSGSVTASWTLQDWNEATGTASLATACPQGGDTIIVYSLPAGDTDPSLAYKDLFDCSVTGSGTASALPVGDYTVWVEVTDHAGTALYAQSDSQAATVVGGGNTPVSFQFQLNAAPVSAQWTLVDNTGAATSCAGVGGIETEAMQGTSLPISDQFDCAAGSGTTNPLPVAIYQFGLAAVDNSNPPKALGPESTPISLNVQYGSNHPFNAGSFVVQVGF